MMGKQAMMQGEFLSQSLVIMITPFQEKYVHDSSLYVGRGKILLVHVHVQMHAVDCSISSNSDDVSNYETDIDTVERV